nr:MAG TPA: hypothetical protein [Caudoviricetes sp.]
MINWNIVFNAVLKPFNSLKLPLRLATSLR